MYFLENTETGEFLTRSDGKYLVFDTDMVKHKATQLRMKQVRKISKAQKEAEAAQARDELDFEQTIIGRQIAQGM
jgi:Zn-finger protein